MISFPPCKINLGLKVIAKRPDGYHSIETCFYPVPWTDVLEIIPSEGQTTFTSSGISIPGSAHENLCLKAYHLLREKFELPPVKIHLHKVVPIGAGLGGGSSDAAHTLQLLNSVFNLQLSTDQLSAYALQLGSDCPFFIHNQPMLGSGRGEELSLVQKVLSGKFIVIVKPDLHISTAEAYSNVKPRIPEKAIRDIIEKSPMHTWREELKNDFEDSIFQKYPTLNEIKKTFYQHGALYASMSGSGSAVFGIFEKEIDFPFQQGTHWSGYSN